MGGENVGNREKWFTESTHHSRRFNNKGDPGPKATAEFTLHKHGYEEIRSSVLRQKGSKAHQPKEGPKRNIFNEELLENHPKGKINIALKGNENVDNFNKHVISVKKIDPHNFMNKNGKLRWLRRNKWTAGAFALGVAIDGASLTISIIEDDGSFGRETTITVSAMAGNALGSAIGTAIGSLLGGFPAPVLGFIGGLIGSVIAESIAGFFLHMCVNPVAPGPGPPILATDPQPFVYGVPDDGRYTGTQGVPSMGRDTGAIGAPSMGRDTKATGTPPARWMTR